MLDKESFDEKTVASKTNGTGPYTLTQQVINSQWVVTRRDDYWGDKPAFKTITFKFLSEDTQKVNAIETGTTDICSVPFQDISYVQKIKNMNVALSYSGQGKCIYMNIDKRSPFHNNDDARRAVALAVDRQAITTAAYSGYAKVSRMPVSAGKFDEDPSYLDIGTYKTGQNLEKAKQLAISSGLVNKEILLINNGNLDSTTVAELVQADLKKIGVNAKIWTLDPGSWKNVIHDPTQWDMAIDFTMGTSVAKGIDMWYRQGGGGSYLTNDFAGSKELAELDEKAISEPDNAKRLPMVKRMTEILSDSMLWYGLCDLQTAVAYNKGIKNFSQKSDGTVVYYRLSW
jgi:peptide/nickel transport system substrate-binding protein